MDTFTESGFSGIRLTTIGVISEAPLSRIRVRGEVSELVRPRACQPGQGDSRWTASRRTAKDHEWTGEEVTVPVVRANVGHGLRNAVWERLDALPEQAYRVNAPAQLATTRVAPGSPTEGPRTLRADHESAEREDRPGRLTRQRRLGTPKTVWRMAWERSTVGSPTPRPDRHQRPRAGAVSRRSRSRTQFTPRTRNSTE